MLSVKGLVFRVQSRMLISMLGMRGTMAPLCLAAGLD